METPNGHYIPKSEGKLDSRYAEAVRLSIFAVVSLMLGLLTAVIAIVGLG